MQGWSLSWEDPLEESMASHSSILPCKILWTEGPGRLQSIGSQREMNEHTHIRKHLPFLLSVQFTSVAQLCPTLWDPMNHSMPGLPLHHQLWSPPKPMSIESVMPYNRLILCRPLLLLPSIFPSIRVFSNELVLCIRWPKYWSFSFTISPSNEHPGLISFRMD